jgi:hypothetical protein
VPPFHYEYNLSKVTSMEVPNISILKPWCWYYVTELPFLVCKTSLLDQLMNYSRGNLAKNLMIALNMKTIFAKHENQYFQHYKIYCLSVRKRIRGGVT